MGGEHLILVSRSGRVPAGDEKLQGMFEALNNSKATVHAWSCDVADGNKTRDMLKMLGSQFGWQSFFQEQSCFSRHGWDSKY